MKNIISKTDIKDMINKACVKMFCCEDISLIENYNEAINDKSQTYSIHHRLEIQDGVLVYTKQQLIDCGKYFNRPASELIFLTKSEHSRLHSSLHMLGKKASEQTKRKMSIKKKSHATSENTRLKIAEKLTGNKNGHSNKGVPHKIFKWLTPNGEIKEMCLTSAKHWHPDWTPIEEEN